MKKRSQSITKSFCLLPRNSYYRIIIISCVPEVIIMHWLIIRIIKILNPYRSIWIHFYFFRFLIKLALSTVRPCSRFDIHILVVIFKLSHIHKTLPIIRLLHRKINLIHYIHIRLIWIICCFPNQFWLPI